MFTSAKMIRAMMTAQAESDERIRIQNARNHEELMKTINETTDKEIKARNRVDISLDEYNAMKEHIRLLSRENDSIKAILDKFNIPFELPIDPSTIEIIACEDRCGFKTKYSICFDVDYARTLF